MLIGGGGGCIFIYSGSARLAAFEINFISKETSRAEPEYMNIHPPPPINALSDGPVDMGIYQAYQKSELILLKHEFNSLWELKCIPIACEK